MRRCGALLATLLPLLPLRSASAAPVGWGVGGSAGEPQQQAQQQATCLPAISACLRGGGGGTLARYEPEDAPSLSGAACCAACAQRAGCGAWQLYAVGSAAQSCWLLTEFKIKPNDPEENCTASAMAAAPNPARANHSGFAGVWAQHGHTEDLHNQSFVLGGDTAVAWAEVEVGDDVWDWSQTDMTFARQAAAGFYIETALMTGNFAPDWLYADKEAGGGGLTPILIKTDGQGTQKFPPYLDQRYQAYFLRAIDRFAEHISTLPDAVRSKIIASQAMYGSTGDDCPWHGTPIDPKQDICDGKPSCPRVGEWEDAWHNCKCSRSLCVVFRSLKEAAAQLRCRRRPSSATPTAGATSPCSVSLSARGL